MRSSRAVIAVAVLMVALAGQSSAVAAPASIGGSVSSTRLAPAVRKQPPSPPPVQPSSPLPAESPPSPPPVLPSPESPMLGEMLDRVNAERSARGLSPMRLDDRLVLAAQRHSDDQAGLSRASHTGSDGSTLAVRVDRVGYDWRSIAENVAAGYPDTAAVMAGWMASDDHRGNILSAEVDLGVGLAYGPDGRAYWTQVFATPR